MRSISYIFPALIVLSMIFGCKQENKSDIASTSKEVKKERISDSEEFKQYFETLLALSDENTPEDLLYVNEFMTKKKLWQEMGKDQCNLLKNEIIKSDQRVFDYWQIRCNFSNAQKVVMDKYKVTFDSLGKITQKHIIGLNSNPPPPSVPAPK